MTPPRPAPFLFVKHSEGWNVDRCTRWMQARGFPVEFCYPVDGQPFPDPAAYSGVVVFGGRWSANDCSVESWVIEELKFIERVLATGTRYFGVCLGAQMLARVLGARVRAHPDGLREVGFCRIDPTPEGAGFLAEPLHVMQWHTEGFELPAGTRRIATGDLFPNQAFHLAEHVIGVQFHPEVNADVIAIWQERNRRRDPHYMSEAERLRMRADAERHDRAVTAWMDGFLAGWTGLEARAA